MCQAIHDEGWARPEYVETRLAEGGGGVLYKTYWQLVARERVGIMVARASGGGVTGARHSL